MNLRTRYLGLDLEHPIVASASPLSRSLDGIRRLEDRVSGFALPDDGRAVAVARGHVPVEAVLRDVQAPALEPADARSAEVPVEHAAEGR